MSGNDLCGITEDDYQAAALALLPEGPAWPRDAETLPPKFWRAVGRSFARIHQRACDLERESLACQAFETLDDWERVYGLPDACSPGLISLVDRQAALCIKENTLGSQSIASFVAEGAALGYAVEIFPYRPFTFGLSGFGDDTMFGAASMRFFWRVAIADPHVTWFAFGVAQFGIDGFGLIARAESLECRFRERGPASGELIFDYSGV